jgi:hypothetical protein
MKTWIVVLCTALLGAVAGVAQARPPAEPFESDSLGRILSSQQGKPFVLILWSLDCVYCQASLAVLAQEKRTHPRFNIVTLSTDPLGDPQTDALIDARLRALGLTSGAWAFGAAPPEQLRYAVDPKWHGEMPRSYWFDAQGKRTAFSGTLTPALIQKLSSR